MKLLGWVSVIVVLAAAVLGTQGLRDALPADAAAVIGAGSCVDMDDCDNLDDSTVIGKNSCNSGGAKNACDGLDGHVGDNSCNGAGACLEAGNSGSSAVEVLADSCNGIDACREAGTTAGTFVTGPGSCNGTMACEEAGTSGGNFEALTGSCNGISACERGGQAGQFSAGPGSCDGISVCFSAGLGSSFVAGAESCNGGSACYQAGAGFGSSFVSGDGTCNGNLACNKAGAGSGGDFEIGNHSCNRATELEACQTLDATIGDCEYNDVPLIECGDPTIRVYRVLYPFFSSANFALLVDGVEYASGPGNLDSTGPVAVLAGTRTVSEEGAGSTSLDDYTTTVTCYDASGVVAYANGPSVEVDIEAGDEVRCTFVNKRIESGDSGGGWWWWRRR